MSFRLVILRSKSVDRTGYPPLRDVLTTTSERLKDQLRGGLVAGIKELMAMGSIPVSAKVFMRIGCSNLSGAFMEKLRNI